MRPTATQRAELGKRIERERLRQFVTAKTAYTSAGINSATWSKAEKGQTIAERSLIAIVRLLWPETEGDWQLIEPAIEDAEVDVAEIVKASTQFTDEHRAYMLRLIEQDRAEKSRGRKERGAS